MLCVDPRQIAKKPEGIPHDPATQYVEIRTFGCIDNGRLFVVPFPEELKTDSPRGLVFEVADITTEDETVFWDERPGGKVYIVRSK